MRTKYPDAMLPPTDAEEKETLRILLRYALHDIQHASMDCLVTQAYADIELTQQAWVKRGLQFDS